eukprot:4435680-Amphidinium_carterae.2
MSKVQNQSHETATFQNHMTKQSVEGPQASWQKVSTSHPKYCNMAHRQRHSQPASNLAFLQICCTQVLTAVPKFGIANLGRKCFIILRGAG